MKGRMMEVFSRDRDILRYEPILFGQLHLKSQVVVKGAGAELAGCKLSKTGEDFISCQVEAGDVIWLESSDGNLEGGYEVVSVDSAEQLEVSVLRGDEESDSISPVAGEDISYYICSYRPQAGEVAFQLTQYFGLRPGVAGGSYGVEDIIDKDVLRQASVFAVISGLYSMLASDSEEGKNFWEKSKYYRGMFERARERSKLFLDSGSDGVADRVNHGSSIKLIRD